MKDDENSANNKYQSADENHQTILIIEDNQYDFLLMKHIILSKYPNINILYAESLGDAYKVYKNHSYDFVVLDLNLPDGYGTGSIQEVKKFHGHTPIITVSGMMTDAIENSAMRMGASAVISKDMMDTPDFLNMIQEAVVNTKKPSTPYKLEVASQYEKRQVSYSRIN